MRIKKGFTLAEILIVLMVIGVIATLTIPSLMKGVAEAQYKAGYKKAYNAIVNLAAMERISGQMPTKSNVVQTVNFLKSMDNSLSVKEYVAANTIESGEVVTPGAASSTVTVSGQRFGLSTGDAVPGTAPAAGTLSSWLVTDDGLAYAVMVGGSGDNDCGLKADITSQETAADAYTNSCVLVVVDVNGLYKGPNRLERQITASAGAGAGDQAADLIPGADHTARTGNKMVTLTRDRYYIYIGSDGATAGPVGDTVSGRIVADLK